MTISFPVHLIKKINTQLDSPEEVKLYRKGGAKF